MLGPQSSWLENKKIYSKIYIFKLEIPSEKKSLTQSNNNLERYQEIMERTRKCSNMKQGNKENNKERYIGSEIIEKNW